MDVTRPNLPRPPGQVRTIYDGSVGGANAKIQQNTRARPRPTPGASGPEQAGDPDDPAPAWDWPSKDSQWILLKADVTKAHRRIKVLPRDWRFQVAQLEDEWWVNKVGTYGMASAQLYWGRMAALLLRILYYLFPQIDWALCLWMTSAGCSAYPLGRSSPPHSWAH